MTYTTAMIVYCVATCNPHDTRCKHSAYDVQGDKAANAATADASYTCQTVYAGHAVLNLITRNPGPVRTAAVSNTAPEAAQCTESCYAVRLDTPGDHMPKLGTCADERPAGPNCAVYDIP